MNKKEKYKKLKKSILEIDNNPTGFVIPSSIDVVDLANSLTNEISTLQKEVSNSKYSSTRRVFQQLPRHMRRRAASYNIKRLPMRLRLRAIEEMKESPPKGKEKRKMKNCRRWRRRSSNICNPVAKPGWLETHIWHAKRCKMIDFWGFKIAKSLNEKCLKSSYRASRSGALLHDFSYWQPYWLESCDMEAFLKDFNCVKEKSFHKFSLSTDGHDESPLILVSNVWSRPLLFIHPACLQTGLLDSEMFLDFLQKYKIVLAPADQDVSVFLFRGNQCTSVFESLTNGHCSNFDISTLTLVDPRLRFQASSVPHTLNFEESFLNKDVIPSTAEINDMKEKVLLPEFGPLPRHCFPVAVVNCMSSFPEWLMFVPKKWTRVLWYRLVSTKPVKVCGIEHIQRIDLENGIPFFPNDHVHSTAYRYFAQKQQQQLQGEYDRRPPSKRLSFEKIGVSSPFLSNFDQFPIVRKAFLEILGKGTISPFAEIYSNEKVLIGYATSVAKSSLKRGKSIAIVSTSSEALAMNPSRILVRNFSSPNILRTGLLSFIK